MVVPLLPSFYVGSLNGMKRMNGSEVMLSRNKTRVKEIVLEEQAFSVSLFTNLPIRGLMKEGSILLNKLTPLIIRRHLPLV